jgi:hypothetical protein
MALFKNYDPGRITISFNGIQIQGFGPDTFVKCSRDEDTFTEQVGANGDVVRVRNRNRMGKVVITLQDSSPTNDQLSALAASDERTGLGYGALLVKDLNGNTLVQAANAWIKKPADVEYAAAAGTNEWTLAAAELEMTVGGENV